MEERKAKKRKILKRVVLILAGAFVLYALATTFVPVAVLSGIVNRHYDHPDSGEENEGFFVTTSDGEKLWMKICPAEKPRGAVIFLAGMRGPAVTEYQQHADWVNELGYTAALLELRGHGLSSGERIGLGFEEPADIRAALQELRKDPALADVPVFLLGVSMGGATVLNAMGEIPEIAGVIALSPFVSFEEVFEMRMKNYLVPPLSRKYVKFLIGEFLGRTYGEETTERVNPRAEIVKAGGRPVFLIASEQDPKVPSESSRILKDLYPEADLWIRTGNAHLVVLGNDLKNVREDTEYRAKIEEWLEKNTP